MIDGAFLKQCPMQMLLVVGRAVPITDRAESTILCTLLQSRPWELLGQVTYHFSYTLAIQVLVQIFLKCCEGLYWGLVV